MSYALLFLVVASRLRAPEQVRRLVTAMVFSAAPIVLLGLLQGIGLDPLSLVSDARSPVYATLGRANFVGAYLALLLPLTAALALTAMQPWRRGWLLLLMMGQQAVIAWTLARAAWLAAGTGLALFALLWYWPKLTRRKRVWALVCGGGVALSGLAAGVSGLSRATSEAWVARRTLWMAVWQLIRERPLLGYGPDAVDRCGSIDFGCAGGRHGRRITGALAGCCAAARLRCECDRRGHWLSGRVDGNVRR